MVALLLVAAGMFTATAGADDGQPVKARSATSRAPVTYIPDWQAAPPRLSAAQRTQLELGLARTHLPGPMLAGKNAPALGPELGAETLVDSDGWDLTPQPRVPGSAQTFVNTNFRATIANAGGSVSNIEESSVGVGGKTTFHTGNWFAARTSNGGTTFTYINPYADMADFCCDQRAIYDASRDTLFWVRLGNPDGAGNNRFTVGVSNDGGVSFCTYSFAPTDTDATWAGTWYDYPHIELGADYLYLTTNMFDTAKPANWMRTVIFRLPLDGMDACAGIGYNYYVTNAWFTFLPVQGADHVMWFGSNWPNSLPQNSRVGILRWDEDSGGLLLYERTVTAWTPTNGNASCGTGKNWLSRSDQRVLGGARYLIQNSDIKFPGRMVLGFWWNVAQGGNFNQAYIEAAAFFESDLTQVPGGQGRPFVWNGATCFAYPNVAANRRGDIAMVMNAGNSTNHGPRLYYAIADDYTTAPPGWWLTSLRASSDSATAWGDYNTVRVFEPSSETWVGGGHYINTDGNPAPVYFAFGRSRDYQSFNRWKTK